jgi:winged helix DNA-binding protein
MDGEALLRARLSAQLLAGERPADPVSAAARLLAIQAQDPRGFRLAIRARTGAETLGPLTAALAERRLVVSWCNRGTLHLVAAEDFWWLHGLTTPPLRAGSTRRLGQEGVPPEMAARAVGLIDQWLTEAGSLTRLELRDRLQRAGARTEGQALIHILFRAALDGVMVRGPVQGVEQAYVRAADWIGPPPRFDRDRALAELARRYLLGHGPADERDLARWAGLPLRDARAGLTTIAPELEQSSGGLVTLRVGPPAPLPPPVLLGSFEPLLLGWNDRSLVAGDFAAALVAGAIFRSFALVRGRVGALWRLDRDGVAIEPLIALTPDELTALEQDGKRVHAYLDRR